MSFATLPVYGLSHNSGHPEGVSEHKAAFQIQYGHSRLVCLGCSFMSWGMGHIQHWSCPDNPIPPTAIRQVCHIAHGNRPRLEVVPRPGAVPLACPAKRGVQRGASGSGLVFSIMKPGLIEHRSRPRYQSWPRIFRDSSWNFPTTTRWNGLACQGGTARGRGV
jgi:hypothetical protein